MEYQLGQSQTAANICFKKIGAESLRRKRVTNREFSTTKQIQC